MIPMALVVVTMTWGLIRLAPGNFYTGEKKLPEDLRDTYQRYRGLPREERREFSEKYRRWRERPRPN